MTFFGRLQNIGATAWSASTAGLDGATRTAGTLASSARERADAVARTLADEAEGVKERAASGLRGGVLGAVRPIAVGFRLVGAAGVLAGDVAASRIEDGTGPRRVAAQAIVVTAGTAGAVMGASGGALASLPMAARGAFDGARSPRRFARSDLAGTARTYDPRRWPVDAQRLSKSPAIRRE